MGKYGQAMEIGLSIFWIFHIHIDMENMEGWKLGTERNENLVCKGWEGMGIDEEIGIEGME